MDNRFERTRLLVGAPGVRRLGEATVAVVGLGGVGGYALEAVARAGVGRIVVIDFDTVEASNMNRQLLAVEETVGRPKGEVARERVLSINPDCHCEALCERVTPENVEALLDAGIGYAIDAIDDVRAKVALLAALHRRGISSVSCMGAGSKLSPAGITVADIRETAYCPLARRVRLSLRRQGVHAGIRCVYAPQPPLPGAGEGQLAPATGVRRPQGTISYLPGLIGLTAAGVIIQEILSTRE